MTTLVDAHIEQQARLRDLVAAAIVAAWMNLPNHDVEQVPVFTAAAAGLSIAAQRQSVALTNAFIARSLETRPVAVSLDTIFGAVRNGTPPADVYRRPFVTTWTALQKGTAFADAVKEGAARASSAAEMDVQLAMRQTVVEVAKKSPNIVGYRRVPDPGACTLCLIASTQRYHKSDLMPIHNHCGCGIEVITGTEDPGRVIDKALLKELKQSGRAGDLSYQQAASRARKRATANREAAEGWRQEAASEPDSKRKARLLERAARYDKRADAQANTALEYSRSLAERRAAQEGIQVAVRTHGELGPLLVNGADHFTSAAEALGAR